MFGWLAAIGAGIGAVAFDLGTSACSAVAGKFYGEHKAKNQLKKKVDKFAKRLETRFKNLNAELKNISHGFNSELYRWQNMNKRIRVFSELEYDAEKNNNYINKDTKANNKNNNLAKTQIYDNNKYKELNSKIEELNRKIEEEKKKIFKDLYNLLLTEWDKKRLDEAKEIIKNIKNNINKGHQLTLEDVKQLYGIFAKRSWMVEKFSPNIIRQNDLLIKMLMDEIIAPLKEQKDIDYKSNININNKENKIINNDTKKNNLLNAIFTQEFGDENANTEIKKYKVFFDFLAQYSGYGNGINSDINTKWQYNDCVLVEEFIRDKQFDMYEDIEELPECCKKITEIEQMFQDNLAENNDKQKIKDRIWPILDTKLNSLSEQLKKIKINDKNVIDTIDHFIAEQKDKEYHIINDKDKQQQPNKYQSLLGYANDIIKAIKNDGTDHGLDEVDGYKCSKSEGKNKSK